MRIAVIGAGKMGLVHARLIHAMGEEVIVADVDARRAGMAAATLGLQAVQDPIGLLDRVDAAVIATPTSTHPELVTAAVVRRRPVLCEKPLAASAAAAAEVARQVAASSGVVHVGFQRRFDPGYASARMLVRNGELGKLFLMRLSGTERGLAPSPKTNLLRNTAIHDFDLLRWLSGAEVRSLYVEGADRTGETFDPRRDPDTVVVTAELSDGSLGCLTTTRLSPLGYDVRAELVGSLDHVVVGWSERSPVRRLDSGGRETQGPNTWQSWEDRFEAAYRNELAAFLDAVRGIPSTVAATVHDAVEAQRISEAARRSLELGGRVELSH